MPGADEGAHSPTLLHELLANARALGFLGPGPLEPQIRHAQGFTAVGRRLSILQAAHRVVDPGVEAQLGERAVVDRRGGARLPLTAQAVIGCR